MQPLLANVLPDTVQGWVTLTVALLWIPYLLVELLRRKPTLAEELKALAESTTKELKALAEEVSKRATKAEMDERCDKLRIDAEGEIARLRQDAADRHLENRERLTRLEDKEDVNSNSIARLEAKIEDLVASNALLGTKLDRLIERLSTPAKSA